MTAKKESQELGGRQKEAFPIGQLEDEVKRLMELDRMRQAKVTWLTGEKEKLELAVKDLTAANQAWR